MENQNGTTRRAFVGGAAAAGAALAALPRSAAEAAAATAGSSTRSADVVVVGAGLAGLTAARRLAQKGRSVIVLEARGRVGGRTLNHDLGGGAVADLGGTFIGPTQDRIAALANEVGMKTFPTYNSGNNVFFGGGRREEFSSGTPFGPVPPDPAVLADAVAVVAQLDQMAGSVPVDKPWTAPNADELDSQTLSTWLATHGTNNSDFRAVVNGVTESVFGAETADISLLYTLFYIASSGNAQNPGTFERNFSTSGGAQESHFVGGAQLISLRMAAALGSRVVLGSPVRRIQQTGGGVIVTSDRVTVSAQQVVVAIPPTLAGRIEYAPDLPPLRDQLTQHAPQGSLMKFDAVYDHAWWRDKGLSGQAVGETGPAKITFDASPENGRPGVLLGFVGGHEARYWEQQPADALRAAALKNFADYFGPEALSPRDTVVFNWSAEEWNRGCPVAVYPPGVLVEFGAGLREPVGRIHWAGTETSDYWNGYMDGAVRSGERAAAEVLPLLRTSPAARRRRKKRRHHRRHRRGARFTG